MSIDPKDPRLTAYALGELDDNERRAFEAEMDADARGEVAAIREAAEALRVDLASETTPGLKPAQREAITAAAGNRKPRRWIWPAAAAALLVSVSLVAWNATRSIVSRSLSQPIALFETEEAHRKLVADAPATNTPSLRSEAVRLEEFKEQLLRSRSPSGQLNNLLASNSEADVKNQMVSTGSDEFYLFRGGRGGRGRPAYEVLGPIPSGPLPFDTGAGGFNTALRIADEDKAGFNTEGYDRIHENAFYDVAIADTSTFSIDVDTASYANMRRFLLQDQLPPPDAVRIEELINYFDYEYEAPGLDAEHPFQAHVEIAGCPWNSAHRLARIALKGKVIPFEDRSPMNLVFLLDVSGSMKSANKLPLVKQAMKKLVGELGPADQVAIAVYAGAAGLVLPTTPGDQKENILAAIDRLEAGGSTNGGQGIQLAYDTATAHFIKGAVNRVILATDGDFNVGVSDQGSLLRLIEERAKSGVFLSVLGFGMGNYKDDLLEKLSNSGNGNYAYIDSFDEACKVLVDGLGGTLITIAKDVKLQIFFNPQHVAGYRLIGYENRLLEKQDFNDDTVDAGEIGVGHAVTALYELVPAGVDLPGPTVDPNPFVQGQEASPIADSAAWFRLRMRYKEPEGETSALMEQDAADTGTTFDKASTDFQWAASVASFGMLLRKSEHSGNMSLDGVLEIAESNLGTDRAGYRIEFLGLVQKAKQIWDR